MKTRIALAVTLLVLMLGAMSLLSSKSLTGQTVIVADGTGPIQTCRPGKPCDP